MFVTAATVLALGCTELKDGTDKRELQLPDNWKCLTAEPELPAYDPSVAFVAYAVPIFDFANPPLKVPDLEVTVCQISDSECPLNRQAGRVEGPVDTAVEIGGILITVPVYRILIPLKAEAYIRMKAPNYVPQEYYFGGPLIGSPTLETVDVGAGLKAAVIRALPLTPVKISDADALANGIGQRRDPNGAIVAVRTIDCTGQPAAGVTLSLGLAEGLPFTYQSSQALASETGEPQPTDEKGLAGFANIVLPNGVPLYNVSLEGESPVGLAYGKLSLRIRAGQMTSTEIRPYSNKMGR